ncbi:hypothetical protein JP75_14295 [Devosia riboflavina]|uniref:Uncharacterized protein n=1 Tax=Devosia riboflavina TaxID=46914 RepID=A0A087M188_9HYPH|nr:hypothetical protein [Devosia riboflavina]KFL30641.1 hypothetical protein JP75_14295 [Devosia riboflavina]
MREIYIEQDQYAALIAALMNLKPANPFGGGIEQSDIMVALGEGANIWPSSVIEDAGQGYRLQRANHQPIPAKNDNQDDDDF